MKKTIAVVINTSWNIYNFRLGLLKALQQEGYEIVAIAPKDSYSEKLKAMGFGYHEVKMNNKGTNPLEDTKLVYDLYKLYKQVAPDIILQYTIKPNIYGSVAAKMLQIPVISNISGLGTVFLNENLSSKIARKLYQIALKVPKKVFYQNAHDRQLFIDNKLVKEEKTDLLPGSGIDTVKFSPKEKIRKDGKLQFLFIARLVKDKGLMEYVEAARKFIDKPEIEFCILGAYYPGNPTAVTPEQVSAWEVEGVIKYLGTSDNVASIIAEADCIVLPSYREGLSRVLLEAASMAKPIVTTNVPGCKDVVDDGVNGFLCEVKCATSLAEQLQRMSALTASERESLGQKGREKVIREFDEKLVIEKYKTAIEVLTGIEQNV